LLSLVGWIDTVCLGLAAIAVFFDGGLPAGAAVLSRRNDTQKNQWSAKACAFCFLRLAVMILSSELFNLFIFSRPRTF
jgi:hypothetical protein